jgi:hypothetical protein
MVTLTMAMIAMEAKSLRGRDKRLKTEKFSGPTPLLCQKSQPGKAPGNEPPGGMTICL